MSNQPGMPMSQHMMGPPPPQDHKDHKVAIVKQLASPKNVFIGTGVILLAMLCIVPVWNALALLQDINYVFWQGRSVPTWMVSLCVGIIVLYVLTIFSFFSYARPQVQTEQTIMMIANIFITLLGLVLMLLSLPLSQQSIDTYNNLMHRCDYSEQTHRMYEYSQVLHNIRRTPICATKYSVEECAGYEDAPPYTTFLKAMEADFRCSGFCYRPPTSVVAAQVGQAGYVGDSSKASVAVSSSAVVAVEGQQEQRQEAQDENLKNKEQVEAHQHAPATVAYAHTVEEHAEEAPAAVAHEHAVEEHAEAHNSTASESLAQRSHAGRQRHHQEYVISLDTPVGKQSASLLQRQVNTPPAVTTVMSEYQYPPTLFSDANYQASCEGMAARDMKNFAGDVGFQTFYQGIYLVLIAIATGFLKLIGFCVKKEQK